MKIKVLLKIVPVIVILALLIWEMSFYSYSLQPENVVGSELYIKNVGKVTVDNVWKRNDKVIIVYTSNSQMGYAFFKEGVVPGRYKEYHNFLTDDNTVYEAIEVENVLLSITITKGEVIENSFTIKKDLTRSRVFGILFLFLVYSFIDGLRKSKQNTK